MKTDPTAEFQSILFDLPKERRNHMIQCSEHQFGINTLPCNLEWITHVTLSVTCEMEALHFYTICGNSA